MMLHMDPNADVELLNASADAELEVDAAPEPSQEAERERQTEAWHRALKDGRIEFMCKTPGFRMRVSAPEEQAWEAIDMFERWTGLEISSERRPRRTVAPPPGQLTMTELESFHD